GMGGRRNCCALLSFLFTWQLETIGPSTCPSVSHHAGASVSDYASASIFDQASPSVSGADHGNGDIRAITQRTGKRCKHSACVANTDRNFAALFQSSNRFSYDGKTALNTATRS